jgi:AcrR family transcriptional regulator
VTRRGYDTTRRRAEADRNRAAIVEACRELLLRDGYRSTTIKAVADRAGVSPQLLYKSFGTKQNLVKAVYDAALAGDVEPVAIGDRQVIADIWATPVGIDKVRRYAAFVTTIMQRLSDLIVVLADTDPEVAQVREATEQERLTGIRAFVDHLTQSGHLPAGVDAARAADSCWALTSPVVFQQLVRGRGWPAGAYEAWLAKMLGAALSIS